MTNPYEAQKRQIKVQQLAAVITLDAVMAGEDWLSKAFAEKLEQAGDDFWKKAAEKGGCRVPSRETCAAVVDFFRRCAAKVQLVRPTQRAAEA